MAATRTSFLTIRGVVFELGEIKFVGMEVERSLENAEGLLLVEHPNSKEIADLEYEAASFLKQRCLGIANVLVKDNDQPQGREMRPQIDKGLLWIPGKLGECAAR